MSEAVKTSFGGVIKFIENEVGYNLNSQLIAGLDQEMCEADLGCSIEYELEGKEFLIDREIVFGKEDEILSEDFIISVIKSI